MPDILRTPGSDLEPPASPADAPAASSPLDAPVVDAGAARPGKRPHSHSPTPPSSIDSNSSEMDNSIKNKRMDGVEMIARMEALRHADVA